MGTNPSIYLTVVTREAIRVCKHFSGHRTKGRLHGTASISCRLDYTTLKTYRREASPHTSVVFRRQAFPEQNAEDVRTGASHERTQPRSERPRLPPRTCGTPGTAARPNPPAVRSPAAWTDPSRSSGRRSHGPSGWWSRRRKTGQEVSRTRQDGWTSCRGREAGAGTREPQTGKRRRPVPRAATASGSAFVPAAGRPPPVPAPRPWGPARRPASAARPPAGSPAGRRHLHGPSGSRPATTTDARKQEALAATRRGEPSFYRRAVHAGVIGRGYGSGEGPRK